MNNLIHHLIESQIALYSALHSPPVIDYREQNIRYIFVHTEFWMEDVVQKYDYIFFRLTYRSNGKHTMQVLHERALQLTMRLLSN